MRDRKLLGMGSGLIKIAYSFRDNPKQELALKLDPSLFPKLDLPNYILYYRFFLMQSMKSPFSIGKKVIPPFSGYEVCDDYIEKINGRTVKLNSFFCNFESNFNPELIPRSSLDFEIGLHFLNKVLFKEGFRELILSAKWNDYQAWEKEKLKKF